MLVLLDLCRGLTGSSPDLSSRAGDTGRIEDVLVHRSSGRYAFNSALVVSQVMRVEQSGRTACEPRVAGGVGLGKVESGGTPAHHMLSEHLCTSTSMRRGSTACTVDTRQSNAEKNRGAEVQKLTATATCRRCSDAQSWPDPSPECPWWRWRAATCQR